MSLILKVSSSGCSILAPFLYILLFRVRSFLFKVENDGKPCCMPWLVALLGLDAIHNCVVLCWLLLHMDISQYQGANKGAGPRHDPDRGQSGSGG